jgi:hypothetical protein
MYEDIVAEARRTSEAAVRESQERVTLASARTDEADRKATEASKAVSDRWTSRIAAMRRRANERAGARGTTEMTFGHEDGPHPNDHAEDDELVSFTESTAPAAAEADRTPPFGTPEDLIQQQTPPSYGRHASPPEAARFLPPPPADVEEDRPAAAFPPPTTRRTPPPSRRRPREDDDEDYSGQSWLQGR